MYSRHIIKFSISTACGVGLLSGTALAQIPSPTASYAGTMQIKSDGQTLLSNVFVAPMKHRTEITVDDMEMVSIIDIANETSYSFPKSTNGPMGNMALVINFSESLKQNGILQTDDPMRFTKIGSDVVSGQACDLYTDGDMTACMTGDGIMMRAEGEDTTMLMTSLTRGQQPASLFTLPPGRQIMDMTSMTQGLGSLGALGGAGNYGQSPSSTPQPASPSMDERIQKALQNEAERETKKQVSKKTREAAGNTVAGAVGGGIVGDVLGNEAGGLVGGLFGKKKKKKKKKDDAEKSETND